MTHDVLQLAERGRQAYFAADMDAIDGERSATRCERCMLTSVSHSDFAQS
jgi:hypothetical protein